MGISNLYGVGMAISPVVIPELDPGIQKSRKDWIAGSSPAMTRRQRFDVAAYDAATTRTVFIGTRIVVRGTIAT